MIYKLCLSSFLTLCEFWVIEGKLVSHGGIGEFVQRSFLCSTKMVLKLAGCMVTDSVTHIKKRISPAVGIVVNHSVQFRQRYFLFLFFYGSYFLWSGSDASWTTDLVEAPHIFIFSRSRDAPDSSTFSFPWKHDVLSIAFLSYN